ncbi:hypothetical protein KOL96_22760 [Ralstonia wenshanensis]|uniref:hypothetical protein n=1 Tax=Ralstonia TaxID=48736 RepID=UPI001E3557B0|nr:hypothetical protein [Ralstonia wenshanensis]UGS90726.1 hypothetical protein KOL96_22760 [Ralstonia wenshanensis]
MTAHDRLQAARIAAQEGRFPEALGEYVWFHEHALDEQPSLHGVRLSFALGYWLELAEHYPPARAALQSIRDEKTVRLERGEEDWLLFNDVTAINRELGNDEATYDLFVLINKATPAFAARCAKVAMPAILKASDFELARSLVSDPEKSVEHLASRFVEGIERTNRSSTPERQADITDMKIRIYAEEVGMVVQIVRATDGIERADALVEQAVSLVGNPALQDAVRAALTSHSSSANR